MTELKAGFGISTITPKVGAELAGYSNRAGPSTGIHDDLHSRALVVEGDDSIWALSANEICFLSQLTVTRIRERVAERTPIPESNVFISTVHTHSGPYDDNPEEWEQPLADLVGDAIEQAYQNRVPARIGAGRGRLDGWTINRRFIDRPTDPGMAVLKVEDLEGKVLGLLVNWNCHAVVLGYDNLLISADFPGVASTELEGQLGGDAVVLFVPGGTGDVNPLTSGVRAKLTGEYTIGTMVEGVHYYGTAETEPRFHIGDRGGGTFDEVDELGKAVAQEAWKIAQTIQTGKAARAPWMRSARVQIRRDDAPPLEDTRILKRAGLDWRGEVEVAALGVGEVALVGQPGEIFSESALEIKRRLGEMGFGVPMVSGYANGFFVYLPPTNAFREGGYEVKWAQTLGLRDDVQQAMWQAIEAALPGAQQ
jgi:neutral ceramidase